MSGPHIITVLLSLVTVSATALPLLRSGRWWIRVLDFPRVQIAVAAVLAMLGLALTWRLDTPGEWLLLALLGLCLAYQCWEIFPYTPLAPFQVKNAIGDVRPRIRLLLANVLIGNRRYADYLALVRQCDPDMVLAVEPDAAWVSALSVLEREYPHTLLYPLENSYGMALYSRLPLYEPRVTFLVEPDVPSIHAEVRLDRQSVRLSFVHPRPPAPRESDESTERDAELVLVGRDIERRGGPAIVAGDLNDVAWSHTTRLFQRVSRLLDPRVGRGMYNTFHARYPFFRWPLDHVFHSDHFTLLRLARLPEFGSDHFAIFVELALTPEQATAQEAPPLHKKHEDEATEKVADAARRS